MNHNKHYWLWAGLSAFDAVLINSLPLKVLLGLMYIIFASISICYILITSGAKKMKKIEEV